ncbi:P-II family nitrogen regulator [Sporomusa termitida]|uniref:Nitrogen regulatory PII-like protein n=1 Tax=Sporomusa termitida TaxID=2377 RepID=A0A517DZR5_9FIRM|nr:P-II family nitrogen regulator [Sporomusa termitida]QDR82850.1 Nitrogen regulatory PII-like protein [Sporomusa termitida]
MRPITKIEIMTRPEKLEELKAAMNNIGVTGMTVTQVYGCGLTKGHREIYRGQEYNINLVPKVKVEIVVCEVPVEQVLEAAKTACRTGQIGDGKIFVYPIANAIRIRTGEEGDIAIIDPADMAK